MTSQKRSRPRGHRGRPEETNEAQPCEKLNLSSEGVRQGACNCKVSGEAERTLVDSFGHVHDRRVLKIWPDRVKDAMGLKFIAKAELGAADVR
jgi:hypothetical protein